MLYEDHQHGQSVLSQLNIGMITQFPLDYMMHLVCLGIKKKMIHLWISGPLHVRIGNSMKANISDHILTLKEFLPRDFLRKGRSLTELNRWKATKFWTLLLYTGPVLLKEKLPRSLHDNFMLLLVPITILCSEQMCQNYCDFAESFLGLFFDHVREAYGHSHLIYNIHVVTHLASYSRIYGTLHGFSSFPFENHLKSIKNLIRNIHSLK